MNREQAIQLTNSSLQEGAELRKAVARDCGKEIVEAAFLINQCLQAGGKLLFFGNGGSAADAQHLAAEFVGRFVRERDGLAAIADRPAGVSLDANRVSLDHMGMGPG